MHGHAAPSKMPLPAAGAEVPVTAKPAPLAAGVRCTASILDLPDIISLQCSVPLTRDPTHGGERGIAWGVHPAPVGVAGAYGIGIKRQRILRGRAVVAAGQRVAIAAAVVGPVGEVVGQADCDPQQRVCIAEGGPCGGVSSDPVLLVVGWQQVALKGKRQM